MIAKYLIAGLSALWLSPQALPATPPDTIELKDFGSYHIGGERVTLAGLPVQNIQVVPGGPVRKSDPNGDYEVGQMYVQFMKLAHPRSPLPLLFWHGGGMTGVNWETKPDGGRGWQQFFLRAGFDTYVSDAVERGRASWPRYPEIYKDAPEHRTQNAAWEMFRIGPAGGYVSDPAKRVAYAGSQFPVAYFDQFWKQTVPRWTGTDSLAQKAYDQLLGQVGPGLLISHSQGCTFAFRAALNQPERLKAMVLLDPSGAPDPRAADVARVKAIKLLVIWSDNFDKSALWQSYRANVNRYLDAVIRAGAAVDVIDLPATGIHGNSHMMMMDRNSDQIAQLTLDWMRRNRLVD